MLEQFLKFITPGPLTEEFGFRLRVFTSWISLGLILEPIIGIIALNSGAAAPDGAVVLVLQYLIRTPIIFCIFGLIGLCLDSYQGEAEHYGWYWWLFPIIIYIATGFWLAILLLGSIFGFAGMNLPSRSRRRQPQFNPEQFRRELQKMKLEELLNKFGQEFEVLEKKNQLKPEEKKVVKKIRSLDRAALRSQLQEALSDDELEILFILLIKILSGELG